MPTRTSLLALLVLLPSLTGCLHDRFGPTFLRVRLDDTGTHALIYAYSGAHRVSIIWDDRGEKVVATKYYLFRYRLPADESRPVLLSIRQIDPAEIPETNEYLRQPAPYGTTQPARDALDAFPHAPLPRHFYPVAVRRAGPTTLVLVGQSPLRFKPGTFFRSPPALSWMILDSDGRRFTLPTPNPLAADQFDAAHHRVLFTGLSPGRTTSSGRNIPIFQMLVWDYLANRSIGYAFCIEDDFTAAHPGPPPG